MLRDEPIGVFQLQTSDGNPMVSRSQIGDYIAKITEGDTDYIKISCRKQFLYMHRQVFHALNSGNEVDQRGEQNNDYACVDHNVEDYQEIAKFMYLGAFCAPVSKFSDDHFIAIAFDRDGQVISRIDTVPGQEGLAKRISELHAALKFEVDNKGRRVITLDPRYVNGADTFQDFTPVRLPAVPFVMSLKKIIKDCYCERCDKKLNNFEQLVSHMSACDKNVNNQFG